MQTPPEVMDTLANSLKRKRELLPLGTPPPQPTTASASLEQRSVLRVNRACNTCRRQKMRCDGPDKNTPCSRCKNAGVECIFEKIPPNKGHVISTTSRIASLEGRMEVMQATQVQMHNSIQEILHELRRRPVGYSPPGAHAPAGSHLEPWKPTSRSPFDPEASVSTPFSSQDTPQLPPKTLDEVQQSGSPANQHRHPSLPPIHSLLSPYATPPEYSFSLSSRAQTTIYPPDADTFPHPSFTSTPSHSTGQQQAFAGSSRDSNTWPHAAPSFTPPSSTDPTRSPSDQSGRSDNVSVPRVDPYDGAGLVTSDGANQTGPHKRQMDARHVLRDDSGSRVWNPHDHIKEFRAEDSTRPDAIKRGLLTERVAQSLFDLFFERCHPRMPIFDPKTDSFESMRFRSPFCFCCVLMVATKARDGGNQPSAAQLALWDEAMQRAKDSMFQRVKDLEVIQGLLLLSAWSESTGGTSWTLAGHAIRCGVELGIHKALSKLASEPRNKEDEDVTHVLVCSARVWCALFAFEYQLSFGIGRYTMTGSHKTVKNARETLLRHRLSNPNDMRLVSACEIMVMEYQILETLPNTDAEDPRCQTILQEARLRMDTWHSEWDALISPFFPPEHYMRQTISVQRCYGYMTVHLACMPRNVTSEEVDTLSHHEKDNCFRAVSAAREIVKISVEEPSYRDGLRYSPTCFYSGVSFVGALVLRLGCVLHGEQEYNNSIVEELARVLRDVPACRFKFSFVALLKERQQEQPQSVKRPNPTFPSQADGIESQLPTPSGRHDDPSP